MWGNKERVYYSISEIIERYGISRTGLDNCILNETLAVHVWLPPASVFRIVEVVIDNQVLLQKTESHWEGYTGIFAADYRKILQKGAVCLRAFAGPDPGEAIMLKRGADDILVRYDDLVVLADGKERLEKHLALHECKVTVIGSAGRPPPRRAVCDSRFRHIEFNGRKYSFGAVQSTIIRQLYDAALSGDPWQHGKKLLQEAGSESFALKDVFTRRPSWRELIESDNRGMYRLHEEFMAGIIIEDPPKPD